MTNTNQETLNLLELLPKEEQIFANELVKRMVLAWDNDFTKLTPSEYKTLEKAEEEILNNEVYSQDEVLNILGINKESII